MPLECGVAQRELVFQDGLGLAGYGPFAGQGCHAGAAEEQHQLHARVMYLGSGQARVFIAVVDLWAASLYVQQCARMLDISEQALVSELNKSLRRNYRKRAGGDAPVFEEVVAPEIAPPQPEIEEVGTKPQERDLLRMLLNYGHEKILVPIQNEDGSTGDEEMSVAEFMFTLLAVDDIGFDEPIFQNIYLDYRHKSNLGEAVEGARYANHEDEGWRGLSIDLLTEKHVLSPKWKSRHKIHVVREHERLLDSIEEGVDILKERRVDRMIREKQDLLKEADDMNTLIILEEIKQLNEVKRALAKRTGRVVVG